MTTALIDADIIAYRASAVVEDDFGDGPVFDPSKVHDTVDHLVQKWTHRFRKAKVVMCLSDTNNFRKTLGGSYKENRKDKSRPIGLSTAIEYIREKYTTVTIPWLEADDVLSLLAAKDPNAVVITIDKDLMSVPCRFFNPDSMKRPMKISKAIADRNWMTQTIVGDAVDGYSGAPGSGAKAAEVILANPHRLTRSVREITKGKRRGDKEVKWTPGESCTLWQSIVDYYVKGGSTEDDAIYNARMARILRAEDYNHETQEITLWHPTTPVKIISTTLRTTPSVVSKSTISSPPGTSTLPKVTSSNTSSEPLIKGRRSKTLKKPSGTSTDSSKTLSQSRSTT